MKTIPPRVDDLVLTDPIKAILSEMAPGKSFRVTSQAASEAYIASAKALFCSATKIRRQFSTISLSGASMSNFVKLAL